MRILSREDANDAIYKDLIFDKPFMFSRSGETEMPYVFRDIFNENRVRAGENEKIEGAEKVENATYW